MVVNHTKRDEETNVSFRFFRWDKTITLGHAISFFSFLITLTLSSFTLYNTFDKRVSILEYDQQKRLEKEVSNDRVMREIITENREAVKELRLSIDKLNDKLDKIMFSSLRNKDGK